VRGGCHGTVKTAVDDALRRVADEAKKPKG
jgi:hypothetical protein